MEIKCWFCGKQTNIKETDYGDHKCPACGVLISIYPPQNKPLEENNQATTEDEWLNEEEEMPDLGDLKNFLKSDDLKQGDVITFVNAGEIKEVDFSKTQDGSQVKTVFQILIELPNAKNKVYTPNATTRDALSAKWGKNTEAWVGKKADVNFVKQLAFGKQIEVLVLEPVE